MKTICCNTLNIAQRKKKKERKPHPLIMLFDSTNWWNHFGKHSSYVKMSRKKTNKPKKTIANSWSALLFDFTLRCIFCVYALCVEPQKSLHLKQMPFMCSFITVAMVDRECEVHEISVFFGIRCASLYNFQHDFCLSASITFEREYG